MWKLMACVVIAAGCTADGADPIGTSSAAVWPAENGWGAACESSPTGLETVCTRQVTRTYWQTGICVRDACMPRCTLDTHECRIIGCPVEVGPDSCYCAPCE